METPQKKPLLKESPALMGGFKLTPIRKRRTKISLSPIKTPTTDTDTLSPRRNSTSFSPSTKPEIPNPDVPHSDIPTSALEFEGFSFWGPDGTLGTKHLSREQDEAIRNFLCEKYNVISVWYAFPFLVLGCEGEPPSEDERPFTIGGALAIWKTVEDSYGFLPLFGTNGDGEPRMDIDPEMANKLQELEVPPPEVILYLANEVFPDCIALSILWDSLVVELPKTDDDDFHLRLQSLPRHLQGVPHILLYYNGPLPNTQRRRRVIAPKPPHLAEMIVDETDYVSTDGKFYPGTMLNSVDKSGEVYSSVTSGVLIEKDGEKRLTCSFHNWADHFDKYGDTFGQDTDDARQHFKAVQGNPGTVVGFVREKVGRTDIALAQLNDGVIFENQLMEMDYAAKVFVHSDDQRIGDEYMIDSFATGKQRLIGLGRRFEIGRRSGAGSLTVPQGHEHLLPTKKVAYVATRQGAYATNHPTILREPIIRDSVCGSILLRCYERGIERTEENKVMKKGEVCAMMHFADLQPKCAERAEQYLCYADAFDPLIEGGWKVVQVEDEDGPSGSEGSDPPGKKRKVGETSTKERLQD